MRKISVWLITSLLWIIFTFTPIIYYAKQMRFPVIAPGVPLKIVLIFLLLLPMIFAIIAKFTHKEKIIRIVFIICTVLNFTSIYVFTFGFTADVPFFYPVVSYTESPENYLIFDMNLYTDDVFLVFPENIPSEAKDINYKYYCEMSSNTVQVIAEWTLPNDEYLLEKRRMGIDRIETSTYDNSSFAYNLLVKFDDQDNSVCYIYEQGDLSRQSGDG